MCQREGGARRTGFRVRLTGSALVGFRNRKFVTTPAKVPITRLSLPTEEEEEEEERPRTHTHTKEKNKKKKTSLRFPTCLVFVTFFFFLFFFSTLPPQQFDASLFSAMTLLLLLHSRLRVP